MEAVGLALEFFRLSRILRIIEISMNFFSKLALILHDLSPFYCNFLDFQLVFGQHPLKITFASLLTLTAILVMID